LLLSFFGHDGADPTSFAGGVQCCYVDYAADGPWIEHLRQSVPAALKRQGKFRPWSEGAAVGGEIVYPPGTGGIQGRLGGGAARGEPQYRISFWHPGKDGGALAPFEAWFWRETHRYYHTQARSALEHGHVATAAGGELAELDAEHCSLHGGLDARSGMATALV